MPPAVGSGCRQTSVATGGRLCGSASSPTRFRPSAVRSVTGLRRAGRTVPAVIGTMISSSVGPGARTGPAGTALPARIVPVPPLGRTGGLRGPDHHVRRARHDLLITAGTAVHLRRGRARNLADYPVTVRPCLSPRRPEPDDLFRTGASSPRAAPAAGLSARGAPARAARDVGRQTARPTRAHGRLRGSGLQPCRVLVRPARRLPHGTLHGNPARPACTGLREYPRTSVDGPLLRKQQQ